MGIYVDSCNRTQNVTVDYSHPVRWVELVGLPVLVILCTVGNVLNIIVMSGEKKTPRSILVSKSTKVFLISMAVSDMILLWFQIPTWVGQYFLGFDFRDNSTMAMGFKQFYGVQQWGLEAFLQWSDWILIAFSVDRLRSFHYIAHTFKQSSQSMRNVMTVSTRKSFSFWSSGTSTKHIGSSREVLASSAADDCRGAPRVFLASHDSSMSRTGVRKRTAIGIVLLLLIGALLFTMENGIYYFTWRMLDQGDRRPYHTYRPDWLTNWSFYQTIAEVAMTCAKFGLLLVLNISLIAIVVKQRRQAKSFLSPQHSYIRRHSKEKTGRNLLIGCLVVYFVTHLPALVYQCLRLVSSAPYCFYFLPINTGMLARPVIRIVLLSNYSINFLLYFALSKKFREELRQLPARFRKCRCRTWVLCCKKDHRQRLPSLATPRSRLPTLSSNSSSRPIVLETVSEKSV